MFVAALFIIAQTGTNPNVLQWVKHSMIHPYDRTLLNNKKKQIIFDTCNYLD